jgi:hypothetical protein
MSKLGPYFGTHTGELKIYVGIFQIGSGSFQTFSDFQAAFAGSYTVAGQPGTFAIGIKLIDHNPASSSGQCEVTLNGNTDSAAAYQVSGPKLTITTALNDTPIDLYVSQGGTQVDNISQHNIWIGQWG